MAARGDDLLPILSMPSGDIIAMSSWAYHTTMEVLRYRGTTSSEPDASISLATSCEYCIHPTCSALLNPQPFIVAVHEADIDYPPRGNASQTTVYAIDADTMTIRWHHADVGGTIHKVYHVAAQGVVSAFGTHDAGDREHPDVLEFVLTVDSMTGAERFTAEVMYCDQAASIKYCGLTESDGNFIVIAVLENGSICAVDLERFLEHRFQRDGQMLKSLDPLQSGNVVKAAGVSGRVVAFSVDDTSCNEGSSEI
ncbi:hypothetical protein C8Q72DRAFT_954579 [Fomitopsis betulina]|nr:hypothetical protein C8Q72DRAFT_954579 [Fomitopsis betulina]